MTAKVRSVMGRVRPQSLSGAAECAIDKNHDALKGELPAERRRMLDYWEELLGSPDEARGAEEKHGTD